MVCFFLSLLVLPLFVSCNDSDDIFQLKGKFKNFNQGELYIYSLMGKGRVDTVRLSEGKFEYEAYLQDTMVMSVVFPNYSEIPVVATPSASVTMTGDASHLKEVKVEGNDLNKELTKFRLDVSTQTPPEAKKTAAAFIKNHPESPASLYLLNKYFLLTANANYDEAGKLLKTIVKAVPHNVRLQRILKQVEGLKTLRAGSKLPNFKVVSTTGAKVTQSDLSGTLNVISVWSSWNYESQNNQRTLKKLKRDFGSRLQLLSICLDANPEECKSQMKRDTITWYNVCDGRMWSSSIVETLGINTVPDLIVVDNKGKITARGLTMEETKKKIEAELKK